jgi:hypothetical protein
MIIACFVEIHLKDMLEGDRSHLCSTFLCDGLTVMSFIPLSERSCVDLDDCTFDESVGSDQFVIRSVVNDRQYPSLSCTMF